MKLHLLFSTLDLNLPDLKGHRPALTISRELMILVKFWSAEYLGTTHTQGVPNTLNTPARHYLKDAVDALLRGDAPDPC